MVDNVNFKYSLELHVKENKLIDEVKELINKIPNLDKLKLDPELTIYICNVIENVFTKKDAKTIKKSDVCIKILTSIFDLQPNEIEAIEN